MCAYVTKFYSNFNYEMFSPEARGKFFADTLIVTSSSISDLSRFLKYKIINWGEMWVDVLGSTQFYSNINYEILSVYRERRAWIGESTSRRLFLSSRTSSLRSVLSHDVVWDSLPLWSTSLRFRSTEYHVAIIINGRHDGFSSTANRMRDDDTRLVDATPRTISSGWPSLRFFFLHVEICKGRARAIERASDWSCDVLGDPLTCIRMIRVISDDSSIDFISVCLI